MVSHAMLFSNSLVLEEKQEMTRKCVSKTVVEYSYRFVAEKSRKRHLVGEALGL